MLIPANQVLADTIMPISNLAGVKQIQERIDVSLNLKNADEFGIESSEIIKIIHSVLSPSSISILKGNYETPSIYVDISGESSGGGGAQFSVEICVRAFVMSPFAKGRSIDVIIWQNSALGNHLMRYDPVLKSTVKPSGAIKDRVYDSVREVATRLVADAKIAGTGE
jgi:hypothetical protein